MIRHDLFSTRRHAQHRTTDVSCEAAPYRCASSPHQCVTYTHKFNQEHTHILQYLHCSRLWCLFTSYKAFLLHLVTLELNHIVSSFPLLSPERFVSLSQVLSAFPNQPSSPIYSISAAFICGICLLVTRSFSFPRHQCTVL
jgi:hypothetical protein